MGYWEDYKDYEAQIAAETALRDQKQAECDAAAAAVAAHDANIVTLAAARDLALLNHDAEVDAEKASHGL